jgi:hypothetical protein
LFANGSSREAMLVDDVERGENMKKLMDLMEDFDIPMDDRYLDPLVFPLVFPLGAGPDYGGHSNVSFELPKRIVVNLLPPLVEFKLAADALLTKDPYAKNYTRLTPKPEDFVLRRCGSCQ